MATLQEKVLLHIKEQIGISFELCDYFTGVKQFNGRPYFNIILNERVSESQQMVHLERLTKVSSLIHEIQPNGIERVAIVCNT